MLFFRLGFGIGSYGSLSGSFKVMYGWSDEEQTKFDSIVTGVCMAGATVGALFCEPFMKFGKLRIILALNLLLIAAILMCMINDIWVICIGRFFWGVTFGAYSVICAKYNNEICPIEYKGPFGAIN